MPHSTPPQQSACLQGGSPFFLWLLHQLHPLPVSSLSLQATHVTEAVRTDIQTIGGNLRHLSFESDFHCINISQNSELCSISVYSQVDLISMAFELLSQKH